MHTKLKLVVKIEKLPNGRVLAKDNDGKIVFEAGSEDEAKQRLIAMAEQPIKDGLAHLPFGPAGVTVEKETHTIVNQHKIGAYDPDSPVLMVSDRLEIEGPEGARIQRLVLVLAGLLILI